MINQKTRSNYFNRKIILNNFLECKLNLFFLKFTLYMCTPKYVRRARALKRVLLSLIHFAFFFKEKSHEFVYFWLWNIICGVFFNIDFFYFRERIMSWNFCDLYIFWVGSDLTKRPFVDDGPIFFCVLKEWGRGIEKYFFWWMRKIIFTKFKVI